MAWASPSDTDWSNPTPLYLTIDTVAQLCRGVGWTGENLVTAIAVCRAESRFDVHARFVNHGANIAPGYEGSVDRGLFQLNSKAHEEVNDDQAYDAVTNVREAFRIWKSLGGTFGTSAGWATFNSGAYEQYKDEARSAASGIANEAYTVPDVMNPTPTADVVEQGMERRASLLGETGRLEQFEFVTIDFGPVHPSTRLSVGDMVVGAPQLDLTMNEVAQLTMKVADPGFQMLATEQIDNAAVLSYAGLTFIVDGIATGELSGMPVIDITARAAGPMLLKKETDLNVTTGVSAAEYARAAAHRVGMKFVGQGSPKKDQILRGGDQALDGPLDPTATAESEWDVLDRIAKEIGYITFEATNTLFFGKPSWLIDHAPRAHKVRYSGDFVDGSDLLFLFKARPLKIPVIKRDRQGKVDGTVVLDNRFATQMRPGDKLSFEGIDFFEADYLVSQVTLTLNGQTPATVAFVSPTDPKVQLLYNSQLDAPLSTGPTEPALDNPDFQTPVSTPPPLSLNNGTYAWPVTDHTITSYFGDTVNRQAPHEGIDFGGAGIDGKPVYAAADGQVIFAGDMTTYGNLIEINHNDGRQTRYAHLSKIVVMTADQYKKAHADPNNRYIYPTYVQRGQVIGYVGTTGRATGANLHFEVREKDGVPVDPRIYLPAESLPAPV